MTKEKKKMIVFTVILCVLGAAIFTGLVILGLKSAGVIGSGKSSEIMSRFDEYYNSKERTIIYYASTSCAYCSLQTPILETIADDYDLDYYYLDSSKLSNSERDKILNKLDIEHKTPTIVIVEDGEVVATSIGYTEGKDLVDFFIENKLLEKDAEYSAEKNITFVDFDEYSELISSNKLFVVTIGQTTCTHCIAMKPVLNEVAGNNGITIYYLNITKLSNEETNKFYDSLDAIEYNDDEYLADGSFGTPLTLIIKDGKVLNYISGERTISQLTRELKKAKIISE